MNNKDFITELATRLNIPAKACQMLANGLIAEMSHQLEEGNTITAGNLGSFDVKKKMERVILNPLSGEKMLVPPKLVVNFKASAALKERIQKGEKA